MLRLSHPSRVVYQRVWWDLRRGDTSGRLDVSLELPLCLWRAIDSEAIDRHAIGTGTQWAGASSG